jgi:hypothetical protein
MADASSRYRLAPEVHTRRFGQELVVLDLAHGEYFALDQLGARIWDELVGGWTVGHVAERIGPDYDVPPERFWSDVSALTDELVTRKLLIELI